MTMFSLALLGTLPAFAVAAIRTATGSYATRLASLSLASTIATVVLVLLTFTQDQPAFADLPLTLALMAIPGQLLFALFLERWL